MKKEPSGRPRVRSPILLTLLYVSTINYIYVKEAYNNTSSSSKESWWGNPCEFYSCFCWFFTRAWVSATLFLSPEFSWVFKLTLIILWSEWYRFLLSFPIPPIFFTSICEPFQVHQLQLILPQSSYSTAFYLFIYLFIWVLIRSKNLSIFSFSFSFTLCSAGRAKSTKCQVFFFFFC